MSPDPFDRRDFLAGAASTLALLLSSRGLAAAPRQVAEPPPPDGPPVRMGLVGVGPWGREILTTLGRLPFVQVAAICDTYEPFLKRGAEAAPGAAALTDYRRLIDTPDLEAVIVATPSHLHGEVALAALQAGRHVYCEAPLASSLEDARAIAAAARGANGQVFQGGLQQRANDLHHHVWDFVKIGVLGDPAFVSGQWHRKESWRRAAPTPERERALNWRLDPGTSGGLPGEVAIHQLDLVSRFLNARPEAVTGFGTIARWRDGREIPDTIQCVLDYPGGVRTVYTATLASSTGGAYTLFQGSNSSLMVRERRSWLIKEADSPLLGWEVYARKEPVHNETGIALVADATKLLDAGLKPGEEGTLEPTRDPLAAAFEAFARSIREGAPPLCGPADAFQATAVALRVHEAVMTGGRVAIAEEMVGL